MKWLNRIGSHSLPRSKIPSVSNTTTIPLKNYGGASKPLQEYYRNGETHGQDHRYNQENAYSSYSNKYYCTERSIGECISPLHRHSFASPSKCIDVLIKKNGSRTPRKGIMAYHSVRKFHIITTTTPSALSENNKNNQNKDKMKNNHAEIIGGSGDSVRTNEHDLSSDEIQLEMDRLLTKAYTESRTISQMVLGRKRDRISVANGDAENSSVNKYNSSLLDPSIPVQKKHEAQSRQNVVLEDLQDETNVVETLLTMTSHPYFQKALEKLQKQKQQQQQQDQNPKETCPVLNDAVSEVVGSATSNTTKSSTLQDTTDVSVSLHCAFLSVANWLSSTLISLPPSTARSSINNSQGNVVLGRQSSSSSGRKANDDKYDTSLSAECLMTKEWILLTYILDLSERMRELNLPLTIPQYQTIMAMIARHSSGMDGEVSMILLNISNTTCQIFGSGSLTADFFVGALRELMDRNHFRDAVMLLHGMKNIHGIHGVRLQDGIEFLNFLKMRVDDFVAERLSLPMGFDEADAVELSLMLQRPIMNELKAKQKALESYGVEAGNDELTNVIESLVDEFEDDEYDEYDEEIDDEQSSTLVDDENTLANNILGDAEDERLDESDSATQNEDSIHYEALLEDLKILNKMVDAMKLSKDDGVVKKQAYELAIDIIDNIKRSGENKARGVSTDNQNASAKTNDNKFDISTQINVDHSTGEVDNIEISFTPTSLQPEMDHRRNENNEVVDRNEILDFVYCRDETWEIPDVVSQLEEWNGRSKVFFSKEYEEEMFNSLSNEDMLFEKNLGFNSIGHEDDDK